MDAASEPLKKSGATDAVLRVVSQHTDIDTADIDTKAVMPRIRRTNQQIAVDNAARDRALHEEQESAAAAFARAGFSIARRADIFASMCGKQRKAFGSLDRL